MGAGALILAQTTNRSLVAAPVTGLGAACGLATRLNPFWTFLAGGRLGFCRPSSEQSRKSPQAAHRPEQSARNQAGAADLQLGTRHGRRWQNFQMEAELKK